MPMNDREKAIKILESKGINNKLLSRLITPPCQLNEELGISHEYKGKTFKFAILKEKVFTGNPLSPTYNNFVFFYNDKLVLQTRLNKYLTLEKNYEIIKLSDWVEELPLVIDQIVRVEQELIDKIIKETQQIDLGKYDE